MFYLVGLRTHDGDDWIYEILNNKAVNMFCANGQDYPRNVLDAFGMEVGKQIVNSIENLDFKSLTKKQKERMLKVINKYRADNNFYRTGSGYWVFKIPIETQPHNQICKIKETSTYENSV